jgi:hypothetical protein
MRTPSRFMPPFQARVPGVVGWLFAIALAVGALLLSYRFAASAPLAMGLGLGALGVYVWHAVRSRRRKLRAVAQMRVGQGICEFARDFDNRAVDTWVIRAVFEQLQSYLADVQPAFPVRAEDRLPKHLIADPDDLDMDLVHQIAQRTGRSLEKTDLNPHYGKVLTVRDLVLFFDAQPKRAA